jgi:hypothetical protein
MHFDRRSRRHFLTGMGVTLALPLLRSLLPIELEKTARADVSPKSFIGVGAWNGLYRMYGPRSQLMPATPERDGALVGYRRYAVPGCHTIHHESLTALAAANGGKISDVLDASFTPMLPKMTLLQGLDYIGLGWVHHSGQFGNWKGSANVEGNPNMATLDVVLSEHRAKNGLPGDLVAYCASWADHRYGCSFRADGSVTSSRFYNPATLWEKYFGNATIPQGFRTLLVDKVLADYKALGNHPRLGSEDKKRLEAHVAHLAATQQKVNRLDAVCRQLRPDANLSDRSLILRTMNDVIVGLISCGMCNVFMGWSGDLVSQDVDQWHAWSHAGYSSDTDVISDATSYAKLLEQNRAVLKDLCLDLAQKLDQVGQLDNSLIVCIQEHSKRGHQAWNVPVVMFGSAGGAFKTNQYVDFRSLSSGNDMEFTRFGFPMNQLYANILTSMGMPASAFEALNKSRSDATSPFKRNSGYGIPVIHPEMVSGYGAHYRGWTGYDMSGSLPLVRA